MLWAQYAHLQWRALFPGLLWAQLLICRLSLAHSLPPRPLWPLSTDLLTLWRPLQPLSSTHLFFSSKTQIRPGEKTRRWCRRTEKWITPYHRQVLKDRPPVHWQHEDWISQTPPPRNQPEPGKHQWTSADLEFHIPTREGWHGSQCPCNMHLHNTVFTMKQKSSPWIRAFCQWQRLPPYSQGSALSAACTWLQPGPSAASHHTTTKPARIPASVVGHAFPQYACAHGVHG